MLLRTGGVLNWLRRGREDHDKAGRFPAEAGDECIRGAAALGVARRHRAARATAAGPATWAAPPLSELIEQAAGDFIAGEGSAAVLQSLRADSADKVATALTGAVRGHLRIGAVSGPLGGRATAVKGAVAALWVAVGAPVQAHQKSPRASAQSSLGAV